MLEARFESPLARHSAATDTSVTIREISERGMIDLRGLASDKKFMAAAKAALGVDLPKTLAALPPGATSRFCGLRPTSGSSHVRAPKRRSWLIRWLGISQAFTRSWSTCQTCAPSSASKARVAAKW